jgi:hypothetical protein
VTSFFGQRVRHPVTGNAEWQKPVTKDRDEVLSWLGVGKKGARHARERARSHRTFASIGDEWLDGARADRISRRKGRSKPYAIAASAALTAQAVTTARPDTTTERASTRSLERGQATSMPNDGA